MIPLFLSWGYMYFSGLMLLEVNIGRQGNTNLMGLLEEVLGKGFRHLGAVLFFFLFYSLLTAYLNASSILIKDGINSLHCDISQTIVLLLNAFVLFVMVTLGTSQIDLINRVFVFLMLGVYAGLIILGSLKVQRDNVLYFSFNMKTMAYGFPVFVVSFGFQNLIPTITHYLGYRVRRVKAALFRGTLMAFLIYVFWNFIVLGMISQDSSIVAELDKSFITRLFAGAGPSTSMLINSFAFFAIITSVLTIALSFVNFIADSGEARKRRVIYAALVIAPPTLFALIDPGVFLKALHMAGGLCSTCLFGLLPVIMVWKTRYKMELGYQKVFPSGRMGLISYVLLSVVIIVIETHQIFFAK